MRKFLTGLSLLVLPLVAMSAPVPFDFSTIGGANPHGTSLSNGGVLAEGFANTFFSNPQPLWVRNSANDHGIGVCSEGTDACNTGGDVNELSNQENVEGIRLTRPLNTVWTSLWVSSLDNGGSNNAEAGFLLWSNDPSFGTFGFFHFAYGDFGAGVIEGDLLTLGAASGFNSAARYVLFENDTSNGSNNDYLVWKGATAFRQLQEAPEPASLALLGAALGALLFGRRKRG